jgi:hypothetical protein
MVPPLLQGTIPVQVEHFTMLIVQGLDLGILLPASFISGVLLIQRRPYGYLLASVYIIFLSLMMTDSPRNYCNGAGRLYCIPGGNRNSAV